jgi:hypothetical protein
MTFKVIAIRTGGLSGSMVEIDERGPKGIVRKEYILWQNGTADLSYNTDKTDSNGRHIRQHRRLPATSARAKLMHSIAAGSK